MKTVLQILPSLRKINGGVERGTLDIARELAEKNFKSVILSSGGEMAEKYKYKGVDHYTIEIEKKGLLNYFSARRKFEKILKVVNPDVIHIRSRWPAFCFSGIIKKKRIPLVTTYHGTYSGNNFFLKKKYNGFMTSGDFTISISKFIDDHIRYFFPKQKSQIKQVNRGIDCQYFDEKSVSEIRKEKFLSSLMISENTHIILLPARITAGRRILSAVGQAQPQSEHGIGAKHSKVLVTGHGFQVLVIQPGFHQFHAFKPVPFPFFSLGVVSGQKSQGSEGVQRVTHLILNGISQFINLCT